MPFEIEIGNSDVATSADKRRAAGLDNVFVLAAYSSTQKALRRPLPGHADMTVVPTSELNYL